MTGSSILGQAWHTAYPPSPDASECTLAKKHSRHSVLLGTWRQQHHAHTTRWSWGSRQMPIQHLLRLAVTGTSPLCFHIFLE